MKKESVKKNKGQFAKKSEKPANEETKIQDNIQDENEIITEFDAKGELNDYQKVNEKPEETPAEKPAETPEVKKEGYEDTLKARPDLEAVYVAENGDFFFNKSRAVKNFADGFKKIKNPHYVAPEIEEIDENAEESE